MHRWYTLLRALSCKPGSRPCAQQSRGADVQVRKEFNRLNAVKKPKPPKPPAGDNATANGTAGAGVNETGPEPIR